MFKSLFWVLGLLVIFSQANPVGGGQNLTLTSEKGIFNKTKGIAVRQTLTQAARATAVNTSRATTVTLEMATAKTMGPSPVPGQNSGLSGGMQQPQMGNQDLQKLMSQVAMLLGPALQAQQAGQLGGAGQAGGNQGMVDNSRAALAQELFNRPLNHSDYYKRNWMWIRCRTQMSTQFDVGGGWVRDFGRRWRKIMQMKTWCGPVVNWRFDFVNGLSWGDAYVTFDYFLPGCTIQQAVRAAIEASRVESEKYHRELYIYNCPGFDAYPWSFSEMGARDPRGRGKSNEVKPALQLHPEWADLPEFKPRPTKGLEIGEW